MIEIFNMNKDFENIGPNKIKEWFDSLPEERKYEIHQATQNDL